MAEAPQASSSGGLVLRAPRLSPSLAEIVGLEEAKSVLKEAIVQTAALEHGAGRLFWRSAEKSGVLLVGPMGLGKAAAAEAAAAAAGARILPLIATEVATSGFCGVATQAARAGPVVVIIEALESAPGTWLEIHRCLRETAALVEEAASQRLFIVATLGRDLSFLGPSTLAPFGYIARMGLPTGAERKQFLLRLLQQLSRVDAQWSSALREAAVETIASLTANYTFAEIDLVVRRAFIRSSNEEGLRDPVALHHFEKILAESPPTAAEAFNETVPAPVAADVISAAPGGRDGRKNTSSSGKKRPKDAKDPMDGIFGWCNLWLPEALHLPPVVWAMIIFGILAHFMARSTYQPYGKRRRGGPGSGRSSSLFADLGVGGVPGNPYPGFSDQLKDWYPGGSPFANFPPPPGMARAGEGAAPGATQSAAGAAAAAGLAAEGMASPISAPESVQPQ